jgi:hypothetical protein
MLLGMLRGVNRYRTAQDTLPGLVNAVLEVFVHGVGTEGGQRDLAAALGRPWPIPTAPQALECAAQPKVLNPQSRRRNGDHHR